MLFEETNLMRIIARLVLLIGFAAIGNSFAGPIVQFQETNVGGNVFTYTYMVSGITFQQNEELDIRFDPALYGVLSNAVTGPGFSAMIFQPNNPPGTFGDYSALALIGNPSLTGPFSVTFTYLGSGQPGAQPFYLNLYDQQFNFTGTVGSGWTTPIPEPESFALAGLGLLIGGTWRALRRNRGNGLSVVGVHN